MIESDIKHKFIDKIQRTENNALLEEMYQLLMMGEVDFEPLELSPEQQNVIQEARSQYKNNQVLSQEVADKEIDEWLRK